MAGRVNGLHTFVSMFETVFGVLKKEVTEINGYLSSRKCCIISKEEKELIAHHTIEGMASSKAIMTAWINDIKYGYDNNILCKKINNSLPPYKMIIVPVYLNDDKHVIIDKDIGSLAGGCTQSGTFQEGKKMSNASFHSHLLTFFHCTRLNTIVTAKLIPVFDQGEVNMFIPWQVLPSILWWTCQLKLKILEDWHWYLIFHSVSLGESLLHADMFLWHQHKWNLSQR
ncbi:hypothetical protein BDR05DRAFT_950966 [Suillus weaverae]|nr:hypothetical protein BDR05DRAFT_950966 [Suillus weaverae]